MVFGEWFTVLIGVSAGLVGVEIGFLTEPIVGLCRFFIFRGEMDWPDKRNLIRGWGTTGDGIFAQGRPQ
jgi:hypothetical protein